MENLGEGFTQLKKYETLKLNKFKKLIIICVTNRILKSLITAFLSNNKIIIQFFDTVFFYT